LTFPEKECILASQQHTAHVDLLKGVYDMNLWKDYGFALSSNPCIGCVSSACSNCVCFEGSESERDVSYSVELSKSTKKLHRFGKDILAGAIVCAG